MNYLLNIMYLMLQQNAGEKQLTKISLIILSVILFSLVIDSAVKGKFVPKNGAIRVLILICFILAFGALILTNIYYK